MKDLIIWPDNIERLSVWLEEIAVIIALTRIKTLTLHLAVASFITLTWWKYALHLHGLPMQTKKDSPTHPLSDI